MRKGRQSGNRAVVGCMLSRAYGGSLRDLDSDTNCVNAAAVRPEHQLEVISS